MHVTQVFAIASSVALVISAPAPIKLSENDVILYGNGRFTKMKRTDLQALADARNSDVAPPKPGYLETALYTFSGNQTIKPSEKLTKRAGETIILPSPGSRFLGWDTLMSAVVKGAPTKISVSSGHSVGNSISVGVRTDFTLVKDFLGASTSIDYSRSWESSQTQQFLADVPADKYGAFVSNAWTNRASGNVWSGSIGGEGRLTYYQADSFDSRTYGDLTWVDGVISLCTGDVFPLARCLGDGTL